MKKSTKCFLKNSLNFNKRSNIILNIFCSFFGRISFLWNKINYISDKIVSIIRIFRILILELFYYYIFLPKLILFYSLNRKQIMESKVYLYACSCSCRLAFVSLNFYTLHFINLSNSLSVYISNKNRLLSFNKIVYSACRI